MYALLLYSSYSMECLEKPISDTMNPFLMQLFEALSQARTDSYTAVANALRNINLSGMTTQQIIDYFSSKIGKIPLPTSMKKPNEFMENTHNLGAFLEAFVVDWKTLFEVLETGLIHIIVVKEPF